WIEIERKKQPLLTPFLLAQFLSIVKDIVKRGLKKSYYPKLENLNSRVKGKILVGTQVKENILKNRPTKTICSFQEFGLDTKVNRFLKFTLSQVTEHINDYQKDSEIHQSLTEILHY